MGREREKALKNAELLDQRPGTLRARAKSLKRFCSLPALLKATIRRRREGVRRCLPLSLALSAAVRRDRAKRFGKSNSLLWKKRYFFFFRVFASNCVFLFREQTPQQVKKELRATRSDELCVKPSIAPVCLSSLFFLVLKNFSSRPRASNVID